MSLLGSSGSHRFHDDWSVSPRIMTATPDTYLHVENTMAADW